jgi:hypothetical protein
MPSIIATRAMSSFDVACSKIPLDGRFLRLFLPMLKIYLHEFRVIVGVARLLMEIIASHYSTHTHDCDDVCNMRRARDRRARVN